jgi:hypothetical protein
MSLGTTNITTTLVGNLIGSSSHSLSVLCTYGSINMWSRYKPTKGTTGSNWWKGDDGFCGFSLPTLTAPDTYSPTNWTYLQPIVNYRLGDFRGYEHNSNLTNPPFYSWGGQTPSSLPTDLYPADGFGLYPSATFYFWASANNTIRVEPIDMGLDKYYFGVRYKDPTGTWWYKTATTTLDWRTNESLATSIIVDTTLTDNIGTFADAPLGVGTVHWELVVCSSSCPTWTISKPTTVYKLPSVTLNGVTLVNSGSFTVHDWITESVASMIFGNSDVYANYQSSFIYTSAATWSIYSCPAWMYHKVFRGASEITGVNPYVSGDELRLYTAVNTGATTNGTVVLTPTISISVEQYGHTPTINNWDTSGYPGLSVSSTSYSSLIVNSTDVTIAFTPNLTGTVYVQLWGDSGEGYIGTSAPTSVTNGNPHQFHITAGLTGSSIQWGVNYTVYLTNHS